MLPFQFQMMVGIKMPLDREKISKYTKSIFDSLFNHEKFSQHREPKNKNKHN